MQHFDLMDKQAIGTVVHNVTVLNKKNCLLAHFKIEKQNQEVVCVFLEINNRKGYFIFISLLISDKNEE